MESTTVLGRIALVFAAVVAAAVATTLLRARGRRQPAPDGSTWQQVS